MISVREFLFSPLGLFVGLLLFGLVFFLLIFPKKVRARGRLIVAHFKGQIVWPFGPIEFVFERTKMRILEISSGRGASSVGGSFPILWFYVSSKKILLIGHAESGEFTRGRFLRLPPHRISSVSGAPLLVAAESDEAVLEVFKNLESNPDFARDVKELFPQKFDHLTIASEIHLGGATLFRRKQVLRYSVLPGSVYSSPEDMERLLRRIFELLRTLAIHSEIESNT